MNELLEASFLIALFLCGVATIALVFYKMDK
jgi:cbb3-type cytochrome oxidase subunit 3